MDSGWQQAVQEELSNIAENKTWDLVERPENIIDSKWVFSEKLVDGKMKKKARLVARGYKQSTITEEIYSPVAQMASLRMLSLFVEFDLQVAQLDVKSAFLYGVLKDPVFMELPEGVTNNMFANLIKLCMVFDSLQNAGTIYLVMVSLGFQRSSKDSCLYFNVSTFILIHVDDLIMFSRYKMIFKRQNFTMKILAILD